MTIVGVIKNTRKNGFVQVEFFPSYPFWILEKEISYKEYDVALARIYKIKKKQFEDKLIDKVKYIQFLEELRNDKMYRDSILMSVIDIEYQMLTKE